MLCQRLKKEFSCCCSSAVKVNKKGEGGVNLQADADVAFFQEKDEELAVDNRGIFSLLPTGMSYKCTLASVRLQPATCVY